MSLLFQYGDWLEVSVPSVERPFGVHLYSLLDKSAQILAGKSAYDAWYFRPNSQQWFTSNQSIALALIVYYVVIFGGYFIMKLLPAFKLKALFQLHNLILTAISAGLLALFLEQLIPMLYYHGLFYAICNEASWSEQMVVLYYLTYLSKVYEFVDTFFLVLRKKPLTFLHTYHHGATALLMYTQLLGRTAVSWVPVTLNLMVHVIMYWYYFQASRGIRLWWKQWVTRLQIIQFVIDLGFVYFASYTYFSNKYFPYMPNCGTCFGDEIAAIFGCALLTSYLFLFIGFYAKSYVNKSRTRSRSTAAAQATAEAAYALGSATGFGGIAPPETKPSNGVSTRRTRRKE
ncbi:hypothetical protein CANCADRAFT_130566 [Tortispora caseinolytica NRRL Y-17796]|uniref:Elongation of fatty acids protein n=1 Tax=Tortispora caseinolytica NRRL Y-17796 TaxID=767744 RepID=A0A1E4TAV7_9ASCO|nr:hypothetical protein CANCADRAFT_130566 [Tortispora caseinolytica NRRL Y-17796]